MESDYGFPFRYRVRQCCCFFVASSQGLALKDGYNIVKEITNFRELSAILKDNDFWVFVGMGGWHGTNSSLDDAERILRGEDLTLTPAGAYVTVFVVDPVAVSIRWGEIRLKSLKEVDFLREKVSQTVFSVSRSQASSLSDNLFV